MADIVSTHIFTVHFRTLTFFFDTCFVLGASANA